MAVVLKNVKSNNYKDIVLNSNKIIGVMSSNYQVFLKSLKGNNVYGIFYEDRFIEKKVYDELLRYNHSENTNIFIEKIMMLLRELELSEKILNKTINELSHSEKRLIKYLIMLLVNPSIIVVDEPFLYLDYYEKRVIINLFRKIIKNSKKTIVIGSNKCDIIYNVCEKVLLLNDNSYVYDDVEKIFSNKNTLDMYNILEPDIIKFVRLAREKRVYLDYTNDIRDLMKEVYKSV